MIVKVCGMRLASNIREAETSGADWMGFIFYERSPRFVGTLPEYLPQHLQRVGVFVNSAYSSIINKVYQFRLDYVQLHGQESPELCRSLHQAGAGVIKAFALREPDDLKQTALYAPYCDWFLFMRKNLRRSMRYLQYAPIETMSNFMNNFFRSLSEIEE